MRAKVWKARLTSGLFNTKMYAQDLERLYHAMWEKCEAGLPFDHIALN